MPADAHHPRRHRRMLIAACTLFVVCVLYFVCGWVPGSVAAAKATKATASVPDVPWPVYGGSAAQDRYSRLNQINRTNVHQLTQIWTFEAGDEGGLQTNPLVIGHTLFAFTSTQQVIALDAATGRRLWMFHEGEPGLQPSRGLSYWTDGKQSILFAGILS